MTSLESGLVEAVASDSTLADPVTLVRSPFVPGGPPSLGFEANEFRRDVRDHIVYTCAKEVREATAVDLYRAFALTA